jgi:cytochrome c oxidase cbb3-type subunit III
MTSLWLKILGTSILLALTACTNDPEENTHREPPPTVAEMPRQTFAPAPEVVKSAPVSQKTRDTYQWYCSQCHGITGKGDGMNALQLAVPPRNHTKADYLETRTDQQLFEAIKLGGLAVGRAPCMPAWGNTLKDADITGLVNYIRELCHCEGA